MTSFSLTMGRSRSQIVVETTSTIQQETVMEAMKTSTKHLQNALEQIDTQSYLRNREEQSEDQSFAETNWSHHKIWTANNLCFCR